MPYEANYPATVVEVLDDTLTYRPAALAAVRAFARARPWAGTPAERRAKFAALNTALAAAYGLPEPALAFDVPEPEAEACGGRYHAGAHAIVLYGRLSVVTYLHEFAHARGYDERRACAWSLNLFRRVFPRSFARLAHQGHTVRKIPRNRT